MRLPSSIRSLALTVWPHHRGLLAGLWVLMQLLFWRKFGGPQ